ncbi:PQQ-binding-like beta-propeller repeat protein [Nannocystaceae bacterium ST9]
MRTRLVDRVMGLSVLALSGCPATTHPPSAGCSKDTDCKGERICVDDHCVEPSVEPSRHPEDSSESEPEPASAGQDERWFRGGPGHAGATVAIAPREQPTLAWERDLGSVVFATPTLATGPQGPMVYVGTHGGRFVGVRLDGGTIDLDLQLGGRIWATAAAQGEGEALRLYVGNDDDKLFAIAPSEPASKAIAWTLTLGNCSGTRAPGPEGARCDVDGGPTIGPEGDLYVGADGVYRIAPSGEIRWHWPPADQQERAKHVFSTPVVTDEGVVVFGGQDGFVTALTAADGVQRWQYRIDADIDGSGVIGADGAFFIGADDGRIHALRSDGSLRWSFVAQRDIRSSLGIAASGTVYATSFDGNLYAIGPAGEVDWVLPTGGVVQSSPLVDGEGKILFGSQDDHLYAVSAEGEVLWSIELPGDIDSSVALADDGTLVVGCDDGKLRAFAAPRAK